MPTLDSAYLTTLLRAAEGPCVSLYQPAHRMHPDNAQDPIRFRNLVDQVEASLGREYPGRDVRAIVAPFRRLQADTRFWNHTLDGVAVLASATRFDVFNLPRAMPERVVVADSFHIKPLLRHVQSADRFRVLALSRTRADLFEGNRYGLGPVQNGFPVTLTEVLGDQRTEPHYGVHTGSPGGPAVFHGQGSRQDETDVDTERFFRAVADRLPDTGVPVVLAALAEHHAPFRSAVKNPRLLAEAIGGDPFALGADELRTRAWAVVEPVYLARLAALRNDFGTAAARQAATADLSDAARAAVAGRIGTLLIDADQVLPGKIDPATGAIARAPLDGPRIDDLLDDLAELVLKAGGDVVIVPTDRMSTKTGLAAIYRF